MDGPMVMAKVFPITMSKWFLKCLSVSLIELFNVKDDRLVFRKFIPDLVIDSL